MSSRITMYTELKLESVKGLIREHGKHRIIDKVTVVLNEKNDEYRATFANLGLSGVPIGTDYVRKNPKLLSGNGVWCIVTIGYISGEDVKVRWEIQTLKPIQISNIDLQEYIEQRKKLYYRRMDRSAHAYSGLKSRYDEPTGKVYHTCPSASSCRK